MIKDFEEKISKANLSESERLKAELLLEILRELRQKPRKRFGLF